jgi:ectoine hydroxylase-related dioxygenase (phytanoyl-CoA dioxygenase family)
MKTALNDDLSLHHELLTDLFPQLPAAEAFEKYKLSPEQVAFFHENGYLANVKLIEDHQIEQLRRELDEIKEPAHPKNYLFHEFHTNESKDVNSVLFHSLGHWRIAPAFHDVLWNPAFVVAASQLLGNQAVRFWHDQLFYKPAQHGGVVAWHQDYSYWTRTKPMQHLTCWVGLDDATKENGCLYYIPKSHRWGLLDKPELAGDMEGLNAYLDADQREQFKNKVAIEMPKGYGTFHHPLLVHGSYANKSPRPRRAFVLNVFADGTHSDADVEILKGVPVIHKGNKMEGQFFPLLYQPAN